MFLLLLSLLPGRVMAQQVAEGPTTFGVATIKPSAPETPTQTQIRGNRFVTAGTTFLDLFKYAYSIHPDQLVGGPGWLRTERFDVVADPETEKRPSSDQMKVLVQQLLVERFGVRMHREQKLLSVYALVRTDKPPTLTKSTANPNGIPGVAYSPDGHLNVGNATMANFAGFLQRFVLDRPVVDQTGISGRFDLALRWTPDNSDAATTGGVDSDAPNLFTAIKEQLGLKLESKKANVDVFVIDRVERPSAN